MHICCFLLSLQVFFRAYAQDSFSPTHDATLEDYRSVTIYDSISEHDPYELRERGTLTYSAYNRSGTFSESGVLSRPHDGASVVYRLGTEDRMSAVFNPLDILRGEEAYADESLQVHLDTKGVIFHMTYSLQKASRAPGTFKVSIDHMSDHMSSPMVLQDRVVKAGSQKQATTDADGQPVIEEEEEEVPEKTFVQKYWIYAVPLLLVLVLNGGGDQGS